MTLFKRDQIADLVVTESKSDVCLSLFMPMQRGPDKAQENRIRLKNMYKSIKTKLSDHSSGHGAHFLESVETLLQSGRLPSNSDGMALFSRNDDTQVHFLPYSFTERVMLDNQFYIKPLLPLLTEGGEFYILALSQNEVQLYRANREAIEPVTLANLPQSIDAALQFDDPEKRQQYHTSTASPRASAEQPAAFHSHHPDEERKSRLRRFLQLVEESVSAHLATEEVPLILAGVDYLLTIYREVNTHSQLLDEEIEGNAEKLASHELQAAAWEIARTYFTQEQEVALEKFNTLKGSDKISTDLAEIVAAAHYGRIETLFAAEDQEQWGTFDEQTGKVQKAESETEHHELTNLASRHTLLNSGTAYVLPAAEMPEEAPLAAIFRYAASA
jgi:hypothetical protein